MYESVEATGGVTTVQIIILAFQILLTAVGTLVTWLVKDLRDRVVRLENLVLQGKWR